MYPKEFFKRNKIKGISGRCLLLMPFGKDFQKVHTQLKKVLSGPDLNLDCVRADDVSRGGHILEDILQGIEEAEIIVADLTGRNPNVFYELGLVHTRKEVSRVILIDQSGTQLPFDIGPYRCISYESSADGFKNLRTELRDAVHSIVGSDRRFVIEYDRSFELSEPLLGKDRFMYRFSMPTSYLGERVAKIKVHLIRLIPGKPQKLVFSNTLAFRQANTREVGNTGFFLTLERAIAKSAVFKISTVKPVA
jgi:hypothetical protein